MAAPFLPDILVRALDSKIPAVTWMCVGALPGETAPRKLLFTFGGDPRQVRFGALQGLLDVLPADEPWGCGYFTLLPYGSLAEDMEIRVSRVDACYIANLDLGTAEVVFSGTASTSRRSAFQNVIEQLVAQEPPDDLPVPPISGEVSADFTREEYEGAVRQIQEEIFAGRYYELNFTQRFTTTSTRNSHEVAKRVLANPAKHGAFIDLGEECIISNSPELFLRVEADDILTAPIKGTCDTNTEAPFPIGGKDHAEHTMVLDMARNDLGRVCETGSVRVSGGYSIERHPALTHLVSGVGGRLSPNASTAEVLAATFPAASITGAPKVEVMKAIGEYERSPRGLYTGSIGLMGRGWMELNVAIRTLVAQRYGGSYAYTFGSGGAIVADSIPAAEYEECLLKVAPLLRQL